MTEKRTYTRTRKTVDLLWRLLLRLPFPGRDGGLHVLGPRSAALPFSCPTPESDGTEEEGDRRKRRGPCPRSLPVRNDEACHGDPSSTVPERPRWRGSKTVCRLPLIRPGRSSRSRARPVRGEGKEGSGKGGLEEGLGDRRNEAEEGRVGSSCAGQSEDKEGMEKEWEGGPGSGTREGEVGTVPENVRISSLSWENKDPQPP